MASIFVTSPGKVVAFDSGETLPLSIMLEGWQSFPSFRAIVTSVNGESAVRYQLRHALDKNVFCYIFGEQSGQLSIGGTAFSDSCNGGRITGPEQVSQYYDKYRLSKSGAPVSVQIGISGQIRLRCLLVGLRQQLNDGQQHLAQFQLNFVSYSPEANSRG